MSASEDEEEDEEIEIESSQSLSFVRMMPSVPTSLDPVIEDPDADGFHEELDRAHGHAEQIQIMKNEVGSLRKSLAESKQLTKNAENRYKNLELQVRETLQLAEEERDDLLVRLARLEHDLRLEREEKTSMVSKLQYSVEHWKTRAMIAESEVKILKSSYQGALQLLKDDEFAHVNCKHEQNKIMEEVENAKAEKEVWFKIGRELGYSQAVCSSKKKRNATKIGSDLNKTPSPAAFNALNLKNSNNNSNSRIVHIITPQKKISAMEQHFDLSPSSLSIVTDFNNFSPFMYHRPKLKSAEAPT